MHLSTPSSGPQTPSLSTFATAVLPEPPPPLCPFLPQAQQTTWAPSLRSKQRLFCGGPAPPTPLPIVSGALCQHLSHDSGQLSLALLFLAFTPPFFFFLRFLPLCRLFSLPIRILNSPRRPPPDPSPRPPWASCSLQPPPAILIFFPSGWCSQGLPGTCWPTCPLEGLPTVVTVKWRPQAGCNPPSPGGFGTPGSSRRTRG